MELSEDEIALYDRQIRLWGMRAQERMRQAHVLLVNLGSLGTEIVKNIVLSGIGHVTILDNCVVTEQDLGTQFFQSAELVGKPRLNDISLGRIRALNPRVIVDTVTDMNILSEPNSQFWGQFSVAVLTELRGADLLQANEAARNAKVPMYAAGSAGLFGYLFADLGIFEATELRPRGSRAKGLLSEGREIVNIEPEVDEKQDRVTTRYRYHPLSRVLSSTLKDKLTKGQLKRVSSVLPLTLAALCPDETRTWQESVQHFTNQLGIPNNSMKNNYSDLFKDQIGKEFAPVSAVIGGTLAQDLINILGKRESPIHNFVVFDGIELDMPVYEL